MPKPMSSRDIKAQLTNVIQRALLAQTSQQFDAQKYEVSLPERNLIQIAIRDEASLRFFQVIVKETY